MFPSPDQVAGTAEPDLLHARDDTFGPVSDVWRQCAVRRRTICDTKTNRVFIFMHPFQNRP
jgi:hypothetical protein